MHATLGQNIDPSLKELFGVLTVRNEIEQGPTGLHLDQQVDIAIGTILPAGDRSKDADIARAVRALPSRLSSGRRQEPRQTTGTLLMVLTV